jgi:undecaprenyl-diphosphatase
MLDNPPATGSIGRVANRFLPFALLLVWIVALVGTARPGWDAAILTTLYAADQPSLRSAAWLLTQMGGFPILTVVTVAVAVLLLRSGETRRASFFLGIVIGGRILVEVQKYLVARLRPDMFEHLVAVHSMSFPSGHAANATIVYLAAALFLHPARQAVLLALLLACAIGVTRPMLGVHWPSDVLGGWAFGLLWTLLLARIAGTGGVTSARERGRSEQASLPD